MSSGSSRFDALVRKLRRLAPINDSDEHALSSLPYREERLREHHFLVREGDVPSECCLLVDGYVARSKVAASGGRQIVSFHMAGDLLDLQHLFLPTADHNLQAMTDVSVLWLPMRSLRELIASSPAIGTAFWRDALVDASIFREWVLNVGRRDAKERIAHMLCEFVVRSEAMGLGTPAQVLLPFTQEEIADATGLTPVHVNRMLRGLGDDGLIRRQGRMLEILDWQAFQRLAGFDPSYLHAAAA